MTVPSGSFDGDQPVLILIAVAGGVAKGVGHGDGVAVGDSHLPMLWLYSACALAVSRARGLALLAVFGTPGMLVVTLLFIGMAVPTAGATTPIEALPGFYRFLAEFEPLRQITGRVRSTLYYDAQADAGLARGWVMMGAGIVVAALFGFGVMR